MEERKITAEQIESFARSLRQEERASGTIENYLRHVRAFARWARGRNVTKELAAEWKEHLIGRDYCAGTVNTVLVSVNRFFQFMGWERCQVKTLRIQRQMFREDRRELTQAEYLRLVAAAKAQGRERLMLIMETICATGIRVSELKYITVEALRGRRTDIALKGKIRTILIPGKLAKRLLRYCREEKIVSGEVFLTRNRKAISRKQIWAEMKSVCAMAGVAQSKVYPHNLRHLFARTFYRACRDVARLSDVLGHSSIETTRIYLISTGKEHAKTLNQLGLVV